MNLGIKELKVNLAQCIELAQAGEVFEITRHKRTVARLIGVPGVDQTGIADLLASGTVSWNGGKPTIAPPVRLHATGKPVSQMIVEDRG